MSDYYPLRPFRIDDDDAIRRVIDDYPLATLISGNAEPDNLSLIPLMVCDSGDAETVLVGHVDANNPQAGSLQVGQAVSFVFQGPNSYASPDIYPDAQLPGWLYVAVKGHGKISRTIDGAEAIDMLCDASTRFGGEKQKFSLRKNDPRFKMFISGIVGFEIEVAGMSGIAKLAQDKGPEHSALARKFLNNVELPARRHFLQQMAASTSGNLE